MYYNKQVNLEKCSNVLILDEVRMKKRLITNIILAVFISIFMYLLIANRSKNIIVQVDGNIIEHKSWKRQ